MSWLVHRREQLVLCRIQSADQYLLAKGSSAESNTRLYCHNQAAPRTPLESPCFERTIGVAKTGENVY